MSKHTRDSRVLSIRLIKTERLLTCARNPFEARNTKKRRFKGNLLINNDKHVKLYH